MPQSWTEKSGVAESGDESITESLEDSFRILQNHPVIQQRQKSFQNSRGGSRHARLYLSSKALAS